MFNFCPRLIAPLTRSFSSSFRLSNVSKPIINPSLLELKVGLIHECNRHPDADKLYVSKILIEKPQPEVESKFLTVCSGLVEYILRDELVNRKVVLVTNLKPSKMRGIKSEAMVLAADDTDNSKVEVVHPPKTSEIGDNLYFRPFVPEGKVSRIKSKNWELLQPKLSTDNEGRVIFTDDELDTHLLTTLEGEEVAFVDTLRGSSVR